MAFFPMSIGDFVYIEEDSVVEAGGIGNFVHIGRGAVIGRKCVIKDCAQVAPGAVLPPESVVPPFALVAGSPARIVDTLPECTSELMADALHSFYTHFLPAPAPAPAEGKSARASTSSAVTLPATSK